MAKPIEYDCRRLEKLIRFLEGHPIYINHYQSQGAIDSIVLWTDADFAGCRKERKSTSGGVMMMGTHVFKSGMTNKAMIALSSHEAESDGQVTHWGSS